MLYGPEKVREIARSILPSTHRRNARRSAAMVKRVNRRRTRQTLHTWSRYDNAYDFEGHVFDYGEPGGGCDGWWDLGTIKEVMWERRNWDKLGAFLRWADAYTAHLDDPEDKYMAVKQVMPDNLIGRHALTHLGRDYDTDNPYLYGLNRYNRTYHPDPDPWRDPDHIEHVVREILAAGAHRDLNRRLIDPFAGLHDLERFVAQVLRPGGSQEKDALIATWDELNTV